MQPEKRAGRARDWLALARASNLPTVAGSVLCGLALGSAGTGPGGGGPLAELMTGQGAASAALALVAAGSLYVAGMILNDAHDAPWDAKHRPERPIPAGRVKRRTAWAVGASLLALGVGSAAGASAIAGAWALVLAGAIGLYTVIHKKWAGSVLVMGACRGLLYPMSSSAWGGSGLGAGELLMFGVAVVYTAMLSLAARGESLPRGPLPALAPWAPLAAVGAVLLLPEAAGAAPPGPVEAASVLAAAAAAVVWLARSAMKLQHRAVASPPGRSGGDEGAGAGGSAGAGRVRSAVLGWIAGFCLVDALALALLGLPAAALAAGCLFALTLLLHRRVEGT